MNGINRPPLDRAALGRALTLMANAGCRAVLEGRAGPPARGARRIGITGSPGSGKSTLLRCLAAAALAQGRRVGVLAIDPSSPYSHGAVLGDRVRMGEVAGHPEFFFRSLASRSAHNGLADNLPDLLCEMERHDFDELYVETVGVGQAEFGVRALVDCVVLVQMPESGDQVQAMKAGIIEIADVFVVNKADLPGAGRIASEVEEVLALRKYCGGQWRPRVITASQEDTASHRAVAQAIDACLIWKGRNGNDTAPRRARTAYHVQSLLQRRIEELLGELPPATFDRSVQEAHRELIARLVADPDSKPRD